MPEISNAIVLESIRQAFPEVVLQAAEPYGLLTLEVPREKVNDMILFLRDHEEFQLNFLTDLCGIHYPNNKGKELGVIIHLNSMVHRYRLRLKAFFSIEDPHFPTTTGLYGCTNWMERETFDFYGIIFDGHPNLVRILNVDDMDYHPLRKEYPLEDAYRTDKVDRFFGREGNKTQTFEHPA